MDRSSQDTVSAAYADHSTAKRVNTDSIIANAIRSQYPQLHLTITPRFSCNLTDYANAGYASCIPVDETTEHHLAEKWRLYLPPHRRREHEPGVLYDADQFRKYMYIHGTDHFLVYFVQGRDGAAVVPTYNFYILSPDELKTDALLLAVGRWTNQLHNEIWVFDRGFWQKSRELWDSVQHSNWEDVILDEEQKKALIAETNDFFDSQDTYKKLKVPWKRGVIFYGPPGNGKTVSIKAMIHMLQQRDDSIPTLLIRTLTGYGGPEYSLNLIFTKARQMAPCYMVLEDLESIVTPQTRSYFLNEVDGLASNDGILIVGSTNYIEKLDPGITKRPSRFDRKWKFPAPNLEQRVQYCKYWQHKLSDNDDIDFPDHLCKAIAEITNDFSFAYIQEAFIASLLAIASQQKQTIATDEKDDDALEKLLLWREMQKQVEILRKELEEEREGSNGPASSPQEAGLPSYDSAVNSPSPGSSHVSTGLDPTALRRGNFHISSRNVKLEGSILIADCVGCNGAIRTSQIDLDGLISNVNGRLQWGTDGDFSKSARSCRLKDNGKVLVAQLRAINGRWWNSQLRLDSRIENVDGQLRYME